MRQFKFGIPLLGACAIAFGLSGCADESHWGNSTKEKGSISLTLSTDSGIKTAKPMFRSEDEESAANPNDLSTYINVPSPEDFSIRLVKNSTGEVSSWSSLTNFKEYIAEHQFETGTYTLTAYYGEKGTQDFEAPYFESSTTFNVLSDQDNEINLTAELQNSMVKINYTDAFKNYMKDYHAKIRTEGVGEPIIYGNNENRPLFIEPNNAKLSLHFTTKDKEYTKDVDVEVGDFPPMAKTLHNITFDLEEGTGSKDATLEVSFDDSLEEENVYITLNHEILTTTAPTIECSGFENGQTIDMLERGDNDESILMTVTTTESTISSAILTIESYKYPPSWGNEIDLCKASSTDQDAITTAGIKAEGFGFNGRPTDMWARLDLTEFGKGLPKGTHKVTLIVTDSNGKESEPASVTFDSEEITLVPVGDQAFLYGADNGELTFEYNGTDPLNDVKFTVDGKSVQTTSCIEQYSTRAAEKKTYVFSIPIGNPTKESVNVKASYKNTNNLGNFTIPVIIPEYRIEAYDAFSQYAYAKISTTDPSHLAAVTQNIKLEGNGNDLSVSIIDPNNGILKIYGLSPETQYTITSSIIDGEVYYNNEGSFITETELSIPNGNFSGINVNGVSFDNVQVGGKYSVWPVDYTLKSSIKRDTPAEWATVNSLTAWEGSSNKNTWFIVPSTYVEKQEAVLISVGYNHNGTTPSKSGGAGNTKYYCENAPADNQLEKAAGELFLGEYTFNGNESRYEGIAFASRPSEISFDYEYIPINGDKGYVKIAILDEHGTPIDEPQILALDGTSHGTSSMKKETVKISYGAFGKKAAKLIVSFKSSNSANPPINIPSGSALNEHQGLGNKTIDANQYKAFATGSKLTIDNVTAVYGDGQSPAYAPKRKTNKRK